MAECRLVHLLETGQYELCLEEALTLLAAGAQEAAEQARTYAAICRCRLELGDWPAAAQAGDQVLMMAEERAEPDLVGAALADLGTARARLRQYVPALEAWERFLQVLPRLTGTCCREGSVRRQMAEALQRMGRTERAVEAYAAARRWFQRFGDGLSEWECARAMIDIYLEIGDLGAAVSLLEEGDRRLAQADRPFRSDQLRDWARYELAAGRPARAAECAFLALEVGVGLEQQGKAQMVLCLAALQQARPVEALAFALAVRVTAMEGNLYCLEFDAAEIIFRLLRSHGSRLFDEVAADFERQGVNIYDYLSETAVRRCVT